MEVFKEYAKDLYDYYSNNMCFFGYNAKNYAAYLLTANNNVTEFKTIGE